MKSWGQETAPWLIGIAAYSFFLMVGGDFLGDGDTLWHITAGRWIIENQAIPRVDYFSHTFYGQPWVAHEWLSEVVLALVYDYGGWAGLVCLTALSAALALILQSRYLSFYLSPVHLIIIALLSVLLIQTHMLARPHVLAFPLLVLWVGHLIVACDRLQVPDWRMLGVMLLWANMHGGATLGIAFLFPLMLQIALSELPRKDKLALLLAWGGFTFAALIAASMTPQGVHTLFFAFRMLGDSYMLATIGEWKSPNFQKLQPLEIWLLLLIGLAVLTQFKLHWIRCIVLLGLLHLSLKHIRNVEILGLLSPLVMASALSTYFRKINPDEALITYDVPSSSSGVPRVETTFYGVCLGVLLVVSWLAWRYIPYEPAKRIYAPDALDEIVNQKIQGRVFNSYAMGGFLIFSGIPPFIDGRADMYGSEFLENYMKAKSVREASVFINLLKEHDIQWTLLLRKESAIGVLDILPEWQRLYEDEKVVVHVKVALED